MTSGTENEKVDDLPRKKIRFSIVLGTGAAIGYSPQEVMEMSISQFNFAVNGYVKANSNKESKGFSSEKEINDIFDFALNGFGIKEKITLTNNIWLWNGKDFNLLRKVTFESEQ